eukprot:gene30872-35916_t
MATGGWGAMGGFGGQPSPSPAEGPDAPAAHASPAPLYGAPPASSYEQPSAGYAGAYGGSYVQSDAPEPYVAPTATQQSSAFGGNYSGAPAGGHLSAREVELNRKEAALQQREIELRKIEKDLLATGQLKKKNWPICLPMCYHNIKDEIPESSRRVVWEVYFAWYGLIVCLCWNLFGASIFLGSNESSKVASWFLAIIYTFAGIPLSWIFWYRRLYNGAKADSAFGYIGFFISFSVHLGFCIWAAIGPPISGQKWAFTGFIPALSAFDESTFAGVIYLIGASFWAVEATYTLWCLKDVFLFFRSAGSGPQPDQHTTDLQAFKHQTSPR